MLFKFMRRDTAIYLLQSQYIAAICNYDPGRDAFKGYLIGDERVLIETTEWHKEVKKCMNLITLAESELRRYAKILMN